MLNILNITYLKFAEVKIGEDLMVNKPRVQVGEWMHDRSRLWS